MADYQTKQFTSYKLAKTSVRKNHNLIAEIIGFDGWKTQIFWCWKRQRLVESLFNPEGLKIVC